MNLTIKYFGRLAELTSCEEENLVFSNGAISDVLEVLFEKYPALRDADFQVAQNLEIISKDSVITETEIALLPPFSGG